MSRLLPLLFMYGCSYIEHADSDPADPVTWSLINTTQETLYVALDGAETPLGAAVRVRDEQGEFTPRLGCRGACSDGCAVTPCDAPPAVRALAPGEAFLVDWDGLRYDQGALACTPERACFSGARAGRGRYRMSVCYGRGFTAVNGAAVERRADGTLAPAAISDEACVNDLHFAYPSYDVRYQVELR